MRSVTLLLACAVAAVLGLSDARAEAPGQASFVALPPLRGVSPNGPAARPVVRPRGQRPSPFLIGPGHPAPNDRFGSVVAIYYERLDGFTYICTGVLLTPRSILTAGHCGCGLPGSYWVGMSQDARRQASSELLPVAGAPILFDQRVCRYGNLAGGNDLALIRLQDDIPAPPPSSPRPSLVFTDLVFDWRGKLVKGSRLKAVGYGFTESYTLGTRNEGDIPIFSFDCEEPESAGLCAPFAEMILADTAGPRQRTDTCGGDSGGPVFFIEGGRMHLVAITSRAAPTAQDYPGLHCGGGGIYTLIGRKSVQRWLAANGIPGASERAP